MRKFDMFFFFAAFIALIVNGQGDLGHARSSREVVKQQLEGMGVRVGYDAERGRMVAVATRGFSLKDDDANNANNYFGLTETYDFSDDASDDAEMRHFKAMWKAYADCLSTIASYQGLSIAHEEEKDDAGNVLSETMSSAATNSLDGVAFLTMAESLDDSWCEVTVAVGQSKKREEVYLRGVNGGDAKPCKYTLNEWVKQKSERGSGIICPQAYCDNEGVWWRVAGVPVDLSDGRNSKKVAALTEKAKRYAFEAAMRTIAVRVSTSTSTAISISSNERGKQEYEADEKMDKTVKIEPMNTVLPVNPSQVRWFEQDRMNPLTGNPVRCVVAALRSDRRLAGTKQKTGIGDMCVRKGTALDQAKAYLERQGWQTGREFALSNRFAVAIGGVSFKYSSSMDDADFAKKRYEAVQQALMEAAMNVAFAYHARSELRVAASLRNGQTKMQQAFQNDCGDEAFTKLGGNTLSLCDDASAIRDMRMVGSEWAMFVSSIAKSKGMVDEGTIREETGYLTEATSISGLSVVRQFESLIDDVYQVVFVVRHRPQDGPKEMRSFDRESRMSADVGKLSLPQWIESQDYGLMAGPRKYIDDKGCLWAIGIVPSAECHRPFGSSLDRVARECAAFAFGGNVKAKYEKDEVFQHSGAYVDRKVSVIYEAALKTYPQELEAYFHRPYVHPLTGRKGVVAICALRQGHSDWQQKRMAREIEENIQQQKEKERQEGMRAAMKKIKGESAK